MNSLARLLGIRFPLLQAGMGGIAGPDLAAAVANAGAGGVLALYRMRPAQVRVAVTATATRTSCAFGVNLIPELVDTDALRAQIDAVLETTDRRVFFTFYGVPDPNTCRRVRDADRALIVMVGSLDDARLAVTRGASAVVLQGTEAGGHLLGDQALDNLVDGMLADGCPVPFLCAGGIGDGERFRALHARGAAGCLCGTLFVATEESLAHRHYKDCIVEAIADDTIVTQVFDGGWPGRRHRVLRSTLTTIGTRTTRDFIARLTVDGRPHPVARYSAMVPTVGTEGRVDEMVMYCGTSVGEIRGVVPAAERVMRFIDQFMQAHASQSVAPMQRDFGDLPRAADRHLEENRRR